VCVLVSVGGWVFVVGVVHIFSCVFITCVCVNGLRIKTFVAPYTYIKNRKIARGSTCTNMDENIHVYIYIYTCSYICIYIYVHIYVYICIATSAG